MTSRERVLCSLGWQEPDRVPIRVYLTPEIAERLRDHFGGRDIRECLGVDFRGVGPAYRGKVREPHDGITYDIWGAGYRVVHHGSAGSYSEAVVLPLAELKTTSADTPGPAPTTTTTRSSPSSASGSATSPSASAAPATPISSTACRAAAACSR